MSTSKSEFSEVLAAAIKPMLTVLAAAILALVIIMGYSASVAGKGGAEASIQSKAQAAQHAILNIDTAERQLLDGGDDESKKTYDTAETELRTALDEFDQSMAAMPSLQKNRDAVQVAAGQWGTQRAQAVLAAKSGTGQVINPGLRDALTTQIAVATSDAGAARAGSLRMFVTSVIVLSLIVIVLMGLQMRMLLGTQGKLASTYEQGAMRQEQIEALRNNKALLAATLKSTGDAIIAIDTHARVTFINAAAEKLTGSLETDAIGKDVGKILSFVNDKTGESAPVPFVQVLKDCVESEVAPYLSIMSRRGAKRPVTGRCTPIWDEKDTMIGAALVLHDMSEHKVLQSTEAHKDAILETALDCIVIMDSSGKIVEFNPAAERTFGYTRREAVGHLVADLIIPAALRARHTAGLQRYLATGEHKILDKRVEFSALRKDGSEIPIEMAITLVPHSSPPIFTTYLRDISERKIAEDALRASKDEAVEESRAKSVFLNDMSDELRTPLNAVIGYSEMLQEEALARKVDMLVPDLQKIHTAGKQLLTMVNDVLDLSRIESGSMELYLDDFDISELIDEVAKGITPLIESHQNTLRVICPAGIGSMYADKLKVRQAVVYLMSNAARLATQRSLVLEAIRETTPIGDQITFRVADTSAGMPPDQIKKLLDAFNASGANRTYRFGGHGLGLVIARHLTEMMGGEMVVTREVGHGPTFCITLPAHVKG